MPEFDIEYSYTEKAFEVMTANTEGDAEYQFDNYIKDVFPDITDVKIISIKEVIE